MSVKTSRLRILVTGLLAQYPLGGLSWHYLNYVLGLKRLGHDVYYLEDTGGWPYNPEEGGLGRDCRYNVEHLARTLSRWGLGDRWMYRFAWRNEWYGLGERERNEVLRSADLLLNVSGTVDRPAELFWRIMPSISRAKCRPASALVGNTSVGIFVCGA